LKECCLIFNVVERVGHENAVEIGEWPRLLQEISAVRDDPHAFVRGRNASKRRAVEIHGVDDAAGGQQVGERKGEGAIAAPEIRPDRLPERFGAAVGEHVNRVAQPH